MTTPGSPDLQNRVTAAFRRVPALPPADLVDELCHRTDDGHEMAAAFGGRHWSDLSAVYAVENLSGRSTGRRLAMFDADQRAAVEAVVRHVRASWGGSGS